MAGAQLVQVEDGLGQRRDVGAQDSSGKGALRVVSEDMVSKLALMLDRLDLILSEVRDALKTSDLKTDDQRRLEVVERNPNDETRVSYSASGDVEYVGTASPGTPETMATWTIKRLTTSNGQVVRVQTLPSVAWANRDALGW